MAEARSRFGYRYAGHWTRGLVIAMAAAVFLALSGAFGTGGAPIGRRLGFWLGVMGLGALWGGLISRHAAPRLFRRGWLGDSVWAYAVALTISMGLPFTVVVWLASSLAFDTPLVAQSLTAMVVPVLIVSAVMTTLNMLAGFDPVQTHAGGEGAAPSRFLERLPLKLKGAELYAVEAEDHYLRLHTSRGSDLILMRLSDAVAELEGLEGAQTHRSWWVAKDAVTDVRRSDGRAVLTLKDGSEAPVSRTYARALRQAGWW